MPLAEVVPVFEVDGSMKRYAPKIIEPESWNSANRRMLNNNPCRRDE
jgi:hypothetical protein